MIRQIAFCCALAILSSSCSSLSRFEMPPDLPDQVEFNRDIRPILSNNCSACHGPDGGPRKANLRLDVREVAISQRQGYDDPAISPGSPRASALVERILHEDPQKRMPPPEKDEVGSGGKVLSHREKALLIRWIDQGAKWEPHWAYKPLVRPVVPASRSPAGPDRRPIDLFIRAKLADAGLNPSPRADKRTLIRRLSFDLLGLPPTYEEVRELLEAADPKAYESVVDRLLASPHFGEKMAVMWLDLVRYADTNGYHSDVHRRVWPYRDWVIRAFNGNLPFDEFTRQQVAGDLLLGDDRDPRIASGFNRLGQTTKEGGSQSKEYLAKYAADRVRTVSTAWLGSTMACAECHDHKFDPFTTRDFYSMAAFFADVKEMALFLNDPFMKPERPFPPRPASRRKLAELNRVEDRLRDLLSPEAGEDTDTEEETKAREEEIAQEQVIFDRLSDELHVTLVTEAVEPRMVRVLPRGNWQDDSGEIVQPAVPEFLPGLQVDGRRASRLDLANWIASPENPLTPRAFVNRLWREFFGRGISGNTGDLGAQGEWPTHPALLDWLAVEFVESGWDVKAIVKGIVMSETYRQSSVPSREMTAVDPDNRLFARQSRFRLKAELVRDTALAISGLLHRSIGGPSFKPYQPEGYWKDIQTFGVPGPGSEWVASSGEDQYRRGLYVYWKRTFLHPALKAFDAPERQECTAERATSNTPVQALVLLNDPTFVESARVFAQKVLAESETGSGSRLDFAFRRAVGRLPSEGEKEELNKLLEGQLERYRKEPAAAKKLVAVGQAPLPASIDPRELAAWTAVCRAVLNLHETITRS